MRDLIAAAVRTAVQGGVTIVISWLAARGIEIPADIAGSVVVALDAFIFSVALGVVTLGLNWLNTKFPIVGRLMSLGLSASPPQYPS